MMKANLIFFSFMKKYTQRADGVKTDACEGNSLVFRSTKCLKCFVLSIILLFV